MNTKINETVFANFPVLETERYLLRQFEKNDKEHIFEMRTDPDVMRYMDRNPMKDISEAENLIEKVITAYRDKTMLGWVIIDKNSGEFTGYIGFWEIFAENCRASIGYALKPQYWGKGIMNESMKIVLKFAFSVFNLHSIEANVNPSNQNSIKLVEKFGFKKEAHFRENMLFDGKFLDSAIYSLLESEFTAK